MLLVISIQCCITVLILFHVDKKKKNLQVNANYVLSCYAALVCLDEHEHKRCNVNMFS